MTRLTEKRRDLNKRNPSMTVSARHRETGELRSVVGVCITHDDNKHGGRQDALRNAIAELETVPGPWKVLAISTPDFIFTDLLGRGKALNTNKGGNGADRRPEQALLTAIKRGDLA